MVGRLSIALAFVALIACSALKALEPKSGCPACLNGGICLPSNDGHGARCFCTSPWIGQACESVGFGGDTPTAESALDAETMQMSDSRKSALQSAADERLEEPGVAPSPVILVDIKLDTRLASGPVDEESACFAVYSALCPSLPCASGLVLEDIRILSLSKDKQRHTLVHVAISAPSRGSTRGGHNSATAALKATLAELLDNGSSFGSDAFGGLILHSGFKVADAQAERVAGPAATAFKLWPVTKPMDNHKLKQGLALKNQSDPAHVGIPQRSEKSIIQHYDVCPATYCISILGLLFLCTSVANVTVERLSRWFYPNESENAGQSETDVTDEFEQLHPQDRDFRLLRAIFEVTKVSLGPCVMKAALMYAVLSRARELTRGFGNPPVETSYHMYLLTAADVFFVIVTSLQVFLKGSQQVNNMKQSYVLLFTNCNWPYLTMMMLVHVTQVVNTLCLVATLITMTVEDCQLPYADIDAKQLWKGYSPPPLSLELKVLLVLFIFYFIVVKLEISVLIWQLFKSHTLWEEHDSKEYRRLMDAHITRMRVLSKSVNLIPVIALINLAIRAVPTQIQSDKDFRNGCIIASAIVLVGYSCFVGFCLCLPKGTSIDVDLAEGVMTLASSTDYMIYSRGQGIDAVFRFVRKSLLFLVNALALILIRSVHTLTSESGGPSPVVPWAVVWTLAIMTQCIVVNLLFLFHETFIGPYEMMRPTSNLFLLASALREIEGFMALAPMLALTVLVAHERAILTMRTGELPEWVGTAIRAVAQTLLLQLMLTVVEAILSALFFTDKETWSKLHGSSPRQRKALDAAPDSESGLKPDQVDQIGQDPSVVQDMGEEFAVARSPRRFVTMAEEDEDEVAGQPKAPTLQRSDTSNLSALTIEFEVQFLVTKLVNLACTFGQLYLIVVLYISTFLIIIATLTLKSDMPRKTYSNEESHMWSNIFPLLPVNAPTSAAMETMVWFVALFFAVKFVSSLLHCLRYLYAAVPFCLLSAANSCSQLVDLVPLMVLLCLTAQLRATSFHGLNASPPPFVDLHMIITVQGMSWQVMAAMATPAVTGELTINEGKSTLIAGIRRMFSYFQALGGIAMYWGIFVVMLGIVIMKPEDVVLANGSTGLPWQGKGPAPHLPFIAWNMWAMCVIVFFTTAFHSVCHHAIARKKSIDGQSKRRSDEQWFELNKDWRMIRWHHALIMAKHSALGSVMLATLMIPLSKVVEPSADGVPQLVAEGQVSEEMIRFMKISFFIASLIMCVKTFLIFCYGCLQEPTLGEAFREAAPHDDARAHTMSLEPCLSRSFSSGEANPLVMPLANAFRRLAFTLAVCEAIAIVALAVSLFAVVHEHMKIFTTHWLLNGSIYLFSLYMFTRIIWGLYVIMLVKAVMRHRTLDGLMDVASSCPVIILLYMNCHQRAVEVAGSQAVVPEIVQHMIFICGVLILAEFIIVLFSPQSKQKMDELHEATVQMQNMEDEVIPRSESMQLRRRVETEKETFGDRNRRVSYLVLRMSVRYLLYSCTGLIIFSLFWMTEEQCLPKTAAQGSYASEADAIASMIARHKKHLVGTLVDLSS